MRAATYEMPAWSVDGMDVLAVEHAARRAVEAVRAGGGPHFLECRTYRFRAHSMYDPELYRDKAEVEHWKERDPLLLLEALLRRDGVLDDDTLANFEAEAVSRGRRRGGGRGGRLVRGDRRPDAGSCTRAEVAP